MSRDWESTFSFWAKPPSDTEQTKCENAERMIRKAIKASPQLGQRNIEVFTQGSYRNNTNVRLDSDVDICIRCMDCIYTDYTFAPDLSDSDAGLVPSSYTYAQFKNEVEAALKDYFGASAVKRGNKAFDVHANTYRVDADVVPAFEHRRYGKRNDGTIYYHSGTELLPDGGGRIINWPQQNYDNGVAKNEATGRTYKRVVRILKNLRNEMEEEGIGAATPIPSYLIECLVWNVPNEGFGHSTYKADVRYVLAHLFNETRNFESCGEWGEVNELKYLFRSAQPWTREEANRFLDAAWDYIGFEWTCAFSPPCIRISQRGRRNMGAYADRHGYHFATSVVSPAVPRHRGNGVAVVTI